jgi:hypothetical protein
MDLKTQAIHSTADYSPCKTYRFTLKRNYGSGNGTLNFILLNPSTATEAFNDPTIGRCEIRTLAGGFSRMIITNIFAFRATDPTVMMASDDPVGDANDAAILACAQEADSVICAWGEHGKLRQRGDYVKALLQQHRLPMTALKINKSGHPAHPLYLPLRLTPFAWE